MTKLDYIKQVAEINSVTITDNEAMMLLKSYNTTYHSSEFFGECLNSMVKSGIVYKSENLYIISDLGDKIVEDAALLWNSNGGDKETKDKSDFKDKALELFENKVEIKGVIFKSDSFWIEFMPNKNGIKLLEIKKSEFKLTVIKRKCEILKEFENIGMKPKDTTHTLMYFYLPRSYENLNKLVDVIVKYFK